MIANKALIYTNANQLFSILINGKILGKMEFLGVRIGHA
ncbi:hypothetical protein GAGA_2454 [Paraglaciecola agarilytica NO2]|uniref:Uncharacterized protein n=1 Tax=Paraglaciecola agarilytica NO2 TaxID=1125747 RepID=A0ABQ0I7M8_9ALTE|nr:hypothetical protein GAGA_2454 [Paraglaciecola agarilytica NO2]